MKYLTFLTIAIFVFTSQSCYYDNEEELYQFINATDCNTTNVTYSDQVTTVLSQNCTVACHNAQDAVNNGNLDLSTYALAKASAEDGSLYGSIIHDNAYSPMPSTGVFIPQCDQDIIKSWIDAGLPQ